jgi:DNA transposition AAA+ family ATPase
MVHTENTRRFLAALSALEGRGAEEACLMVVDGEPGLGKSATLQWWTIETRSIYIRARKEWSPAWMLRDLLTEVSIRPAYSFENMFGQATERLSLLAMEAERERRSFAVVIDEVDHISRKGRLLETLRDLSDALEIPFILVGMGRVRHNLVRFPQVASRVGQYVEFKPAPLDDLRAMIDQVAEVSVGEDLVHYLHKVSGGRFREIKEGLKAIERFAERNNRGRADQDALCLPDMAGQTLFNCRRTGRPVRAGV